MVDLSVFGEIGLTQDDLELIGHGRNGLVARILSGEFSGNVAKWYDSNRHHEIDRLQREFCALEFLRHQGIASVARPVAKFPAERVAVYSYLPGQPPLDSEKTLIAIVEFISEFDRLYRLRARKWNLIGVEASLSRGRIESQVAKRLFSPALEAIDDVELQAFLSSARDVWGTIHRTKPENQVPFTRLTFSQLDLGPHNMLLDESKFYFVDFEYFGIDSAVRVILDFLWHPGTELSARSRSTFASLAFDLYSQDSPKLEQELISCIGLIGLRWVGIMLHRQPINAIQLSKYLVSIENVLASSAPLPTQFDIVAKGITRE